MFAGAWDDRLDGFYLQASSQWDGFRHISAGADGFYGGWRGSPDTDLEPLGMHHWARRGIVGRGVLSGRYAWLEAGIIDPSLPGPWVAAAEPGPSKLESVHRHIG